MNFFFFRRRIRHPFFPDLAADPAGKARGRSKALAGTFSELERAAARGAQAARAVFVLTAKGQCLSDGERDKLWRLFQVPVYAMVERSGRVEAWECEAQNGLHAADGGDGIVCACGRPGIRAEESKTLAQVAG
jgi:hypothetical protein